MPSSAARSHACPSNGNGRNDRNSQNTQLLSHLSYHRGAARACTTTHTGSMTISAPFNSSAMRSRSSNALDDPPLVTPAPRPWGFRHLAAAPFSDTFKCRSIRIGADKFNAFDIALDHVVDSITAAAANTDYFDDRTARGCYLPFEHKPRS